MVLETVLAATGFGYCPYGAHGWLLLMAGDYSPTRAVPQSARPRPRRRPRHQHSVKAPLSSFISHVRASFGDEFLFGIDRQIVSSVHAGQVFWIAPEGPDQRTDRQRAGRNDKSVSLHLSSLEISRHMHRSGHEALLHRPLGSDWMGRGEEMSERKSGWSREFDEPIALPGGGKLVTLRDAANYITALPAKEAALPEWQAAIEALILVVELGGPTMFARIGIMRALNRGHGREFKESGKKHHWGRRKLKRDQ
jgi:hypothetical protein